MIGPELPRTPLCTFLAMIRRNGPVPLRRWPRLVLFVLRHLLFVPLRALEAAVHGRRIEQHRFDGPPIFVVGYWRSGTTFLQTLLSVDDRHTTNTVYRAVFPGTWLLTERWVKPVLNRLVRALGVDYEIQRSPLDFDLVAEADVGLCLLGSPYAYSWGHLYPARFEQWMQRLVLEPEAADRDGWLAHHDYLLRKLSYGDGGRRVVSKTPGDMGRVEALLRQYPDARFVYIRRDPIAVFHSNRYLWDVIHRRIALQRLPADEVDAVILRSWRALMAAHHAQWTRIPEAQRTVVEHAELRADPVGCIDRVYGALDLGPCPRVALERYLAAQPEYRGGAYETSPALKARLEAAFGTDAEASDALTPPATS